MDRPGLSLHIYTALGGTLYHRAYGKTAMVACGPLLALL